MSEGTSTNVETPPLTRETLERVIDDMWNRDPIAVYMREQGYDPRKGCKMVVPKNLWEHRAMPERSYIMKSDLAVGIYLIRPQPLLDELPLKFEYDYKTSSEKPPKRLSWWQKLLRLIGVK